METGHIFPISEKFSGFLKKWNELGARTKQLQEKFDSFANVMSQLKEATGSNEDNSDPQGKEEATVEVSTVTEPETAQKTEIEAPEHEEGTKIEDQTRDAHPKEEISESVAYPWIKHNKKRDKCYDYQDFLRHKKHLGLDLRHSLQMEYCYSLLSDFFGTRSETTGTKSMRLPELCVKYIPMFMKNEGVEEEYFVVDNEIRVRVEGVARREVEVDLEDVDVVDREELGKSSEAKFKEEEEEGLEKFKEEGGLEKFREEEEEGLKKFEEGEEGLENFEEEEGGVEKGEEEEEDGLKKFKEEEEEKGLERLKEEEEGLENFEEEDEEGLEKFKEEEGLQKFKGEEGGLEKFKEEEEGLENFENEEGVCDGRI